MFYSNNIDDNENKKLKWDDGLVFLSFFFTPYYLYMFRFSKRVDIIFNNAVVNFYTESESLFRVCIQKYSYYAYDFEREHS